MGRGSDIPWIGDRNTMVKGFDTTWVWGQHIMDRGFRYTVDRGFDIPSVGG